MELLTGTVTLMFTDIQGSTRLLERIGDDYAEVLRAHHAILREELARHDGQELRTYGDAFFAVFRRADDAVAAAAAIARSLAEHPWPDGNAVKVRIGLHTGTPRVVDGDYVGLDVHLAARVCSAAQGGQVVVSGDTREAVAGEPADGLSLGDLGEHRLSGLSQPVRLFQLRGEGLAEGFGPLQAAADREATPAPGVDDAPLFGRGAEQAALERVLIDARLGSSRAVVLTGEPGIGKTALLRWAAALGRSAGMEVISARGVESEAEVPFSGLLELLRPLLDELESIPAAQAAALRSALDLGPTVGSARFLVGAAVLNLLSTRSERAPLVVTIDDAHWLDESSLAAILFAARRLVVDPVAVVLTTRTGATPALDAARLPELVLGGLDAGAVAQVVARHARTPPTQELTDRLRRATGGNPLGLVELASRKHAPGDGVLDRPLEVETSITGAYAQRMVGFPLPAHRMMALAAAEDSGRLAWIEAAAADLGLVLADLEPGEQSGLLSIAFGRLAWGHPLMRSAAYHVVSPGERRAMHAALARVMPEAEADRRAWHRAAAVLGADEDVAAALEESAGRARSRSAYAAAATAVERAAQLSADEAGRARRLFAAAEAAWLAGQSERASRRLAEALPVAAHDPHLRAEIQHLRGQAAVRAGDLMEGHALLVDGAAEITGVNPDKAIIMLAEATDACVYAGRPDAMLAPARDAVALVHEGTPERQRFFADLALGTALTWNDEGDAGAQRLRSAVAVLEGSDVLAGDPRLLAAAALAPLWLRDARTDSSLIDRAVDVARADGALGVLPFALVLGARDAATSDRWAIGRAQYEEVIALARETGQAMPLCGALSGLAVLQARTGQAEACEAGAQEALALAERHGLGLFRLWTLEALAELELGRGALEAAGERLAEQEATLRELGMTDPDLSPVPQLVEVRVRGAATDDLEPAIEAFAEAAIAKGRPWALARLSRARGLLADGSPDALDHHFGAALRAHAAARDRFEEARTRLSYGECLRRAGLRVRAREQLRVAFDAFEALGAAPWAERASAELLASGERARRRDPSTLDDLTPQELQIGLLLAGGRTTREAAGQLFLSPKTVEYHLRNAYRKLGIHSREELAERLHASPLGRNGSED